MSSSSRQREIAAALLVLCIKKKELKKKKLWVRSWVQRRDNLGAYNTLTRELELEDAQQFRNFCRFSSVEVEFLVQLVSPIICKSNTRMRKAISVRERIMVTLRFFATGDSYGSLQYLFRIPVCTISGIIKETAPAIFNVLRDEYLKFPQTTEDWLNIEASFERRWNFPHCIGAIDGKHVVIQAPNKSGSTFYNYKGTHSIVLLGVVDANYRFIYVDVGCNGRISDGGVFSNCSLYNQLEQKALPLPVPQPLPGREMPVPYCMVGDDAFAMKSYILKPYPFRDQPAPNRIFNYRLSRARRTVENSFGILANRFRVLRKPMLLNPKTTTDVVLAICALHNFLVAQNEHGYLGNGMIDVEDGCTHTVVPGQWRNEEENDSFFSLERGRRNNYSVSQKEVRDEFASYFMTTQGEVGWQYAHITV